MSAYSAICERVGDWWEITVPEINSVTQVADLKDTVETVRDLVVLMTGKSPEGVAVHMRVMPS